MLVLAVRCYRCVISPAKTLLFGPFGQCRFEPSCSQYALDAIQTHGAVKGSWLSLGRLCRCHPWGSCGWDPVPPRAPAPKPERAWQNPAAAHKQV